MVEVVVVDMKWRERIFALCSLEHSVERNETREEITHPFVRESSERARLSRMWKVRVVREKERERH